MSARVVLVLLACLLATQAAVARMYEWVSPASGRVQLSGTPPSWYRSSAPGPRVRVFENGRLVDDTAIGLSAEENAALRDFALAEVEQRRQLDALKELELAAARDSAAREAKLREAERAAELAERRREQAQSDEAAAEGQTAAADAAESLIPESLDAETIDRLKALISEFDRLGSSSR